MKINIELKDRDGNELKLGDKIELFDWGLKQKDSIGIATLSFDDGRITTIPELVEDHYDFWSKALPGCRKVFE